MNDQIKTNNVLDITDSLEAIGTFKFWKNLSFLILFFSLLLIQACFWLVNTHFLNIGEYRLSQSVPYRSINKGNPTIDSIYLSESEAYMMEVLSERESEKSAKADSNPNSSQVSLASNVATDDPGQSADQIKPPLIKLKYATLIMNFLNTIIIFTAALYCLSIVFGFKVSLLGKLGGINHISRAFFLSLVALILLLPWQLIFGRFILGAIYTPAELQSWYFNQDGNIIGNILYYSRFSGYWLVVFLLLLLSQIRTFRWKRAIFRRLEII